MTTDIHIPPEAEEAAARALREEVRRALNVYEPDPPEGPPAILMEAYCAEARAALLAALTAWTGAYGNGLQKGWKHYTPALILPLPTEPSDV